MLVALSSILAMAGERPVELPETMTSPACVACGTNAGDPRAGYSKPDWHALETGEVLVSDVGDADPSESGRKTVQIAGIIAHSPARVWSVLTDFNARTAWQPGAKDVRIVRLRGNRVWVVERVSFFFISVDYRIINTLEPEIGVVRFTMDESFGNDIAGTSGYWRLTPVHAGEATLVVYRAWIDTGYPLAGMLQSFLLKRSLPGLIDGLSAEIDQRFTTHQ